MKREIWGDNGEGRVCERVTFGGRYIGRGREGKRVSEHVIERVGGEGER